MSRLSPEPSPADRVQAALDTMVAQRRGEGEKQVAPAAPGASSAPLPAERRPVARWLVIGLIAATVHAGGIYWYVRSKPAPPETVVVLEPSLDLSVAEQNAAAPAAPTAPNAQGSEAPASSPDAPRPALGPGGAQAQVGVIKRGDKVIVIPSSPPSSRPAATRTVFAAPVAASAPSAPAVSAAPASSFGKKEHAAAARDYAYQYFRYTYKIGSKDYAITSQGVRIAQTEEVPGWNRYRSVGDVGLEYYDNSAFRRTTRRFEVLTEEKDGAVQGVDITVK